MTYSYSWLNRLCLLAFLFIPLLAASQPNQLIKDAQGQEMLLGECTVSAMELPAFAGWYKKEYDGYHPDAAQVAALRKSMKGKKITVFLGTWCGDSKREVPRIIKILDSAGISRSALKLVFVHNADSVYKQSPQHEEAGRFIFRVPTFIVEKKGKELGRIIERPMQSLEKDLLQIASGENYLPAYSSAHAYMAASSRMTTAEIYAHSATLMRYLQIGTGNMGPLNSVAYVQLYAGDTARALYSFQLNTSLFPNSAPAWESLGEALEKLGRRPDALKAWQKALELNPQSEDAKKATERLK